MTESDVLEISGVRRPDGAHVHLTERRDDLIVETDGTAGRSVALTPPMIRKLARQLNRFASRIEGRGKAA